MVIGSERYNARRLCRQAFRSKCSLYADTHDPNSFVKQLIHIDRQKQVIRGAYGQVLFGTVDSAPAEDSHPREHAARVVVKVQHVYQNESFRRCAELSAAHVANILCASRIPSLIETYYVWTWRSKSAKRGEPAPMCVGMVMEAAETDLLRHLGSLKPNARTTTCARGRERTSMTPQVISCTFQMFATVTMLFRLTGKVHRDMKVDNCLLLRSSTPTQPVRSWEQTTRAALAWLVSRFGRLWGNARLRCVGRQHAQRQTRPSRRHATAFLARPQLAVPCRSQRCTLLPTQPVRLHGSSRNASVKWWR